MNRLLENGRYLPTPLRDFHAQKSFFKMLFHIYRDDLNSPDRRAYVENMDWVSMHVMTVDFFLWHMAKCGYTLQRSRVSGEYYDLTDQIKNFEQALRHSFVSAMSLGNNGKDC